ncbi:cation:proton antiporter [Rhizobium sp. BK602]|uniref:cation:proton antiporter n=1 Tax=Rhizobium sp. BK602 TaxID=2586986 RepID=UPI00161E89F3|nr:cation:proton antiporter [Rhizobium sp. BK602]MBB3608803.1 multicomponent Na+:H+ antiporter subunit F [Rhizobium sp. BK602]
MTGAAIVSAAAMVALGILALAFLLTVYRVVAGPSLPDRVLALDMLVAVAIGFIAVIAIKTGFTLYIDIAISLGLVGFLATVAFARFILSQGAAREAERQGVSAAGEAVKPKAKKARKDARTKKGGR